MAPRQDLLRGIKVWRTEFRLGGKRYRKVARNANGTPVKSERAAKAFELALMREVQQELIAVQTIEPEPIQAPLFGDFSSEFMTDEAPTTSGYREMGGKESLLNCHLLPRFREHKLDEIKVRDIKRLIGDLRALPRSDKTVNNVLALLKTILRYAVDVEVLDKVPKIKMLKIPPQNFDFWDFDEMEVLRDAVKSHHSLYVAVLLGAEAGLRAGEIAGLKWQDVNFQLNRLKVLRQLQDGRELPPKWGSIRDVPLTRRLAAALKSHRHLVGPYVLMSERLWRGVTSIGPWTKEVLRWRGEKVYRLASLPKPKKPWHALRHTFCSHLAMRGVPMASIQELAGHKSITTTMRYSHLTSAALENAISSLDEPAPWSEAEASQ